jgi:predicted esterase
MQLRHLVLASGLAAALALSGCTTLERAAHLYSPEAPTAQRFAFKDGGSSVFYSFVVGSSPQPPTAVFFYGGSGCASWKAVMPGYVDGLGVDARVWVLNKRFVSDRATGLWDCGQAFDAANHPSQWRADYAEFITEQLSRTSPRPSRVLLVGVSEGAVPAVQVAASLSAVTHLAIIGSGGFTLRQSLQDLRDKKQISFDVDEAWTAMAAKPQSLAHHVWGHPYRWWSQMLDLDLVADYLSLRIPISVAMGEQDMSVPVESLHALQSRFRQAGNTGLQATEYAGADHRLSKGGVSYRREFLATVGRGLDTPACGAEAVR